MRLLFTILTLAVINISNAQNLQKKAEEIEREAYKIYRSERASWLGTDIMRERYSSGIPSNLRGYFSYATKGAVYCVFYANDSIPKILLTIEFDTTFSDTKTIVADSAREFNEVEISYYRLRRVVDSILINDTNFFSFYENSNYNIVPIIDERSKRVYILTGTTQPGVILFGNDYLLSFDEDYKLTSKEKLHNTLISTPTHPEETDTSPVGGLHTHVPGKSEFMTATDIATIMLYQPYTNWQTFTVVSQNYLSIWSCSSNRLTIITNKTLEKINKAEQSRKNNKK